MSPGGGPALTIARKAFLFLLRSLFRYSAPIRQYMHQQPLQAPRGPNRFSRAGQRSGVNGRTSRFSAHVTALPLRCTMLRLRRDFFALGTWFVLAGLHPLATNH